MPKPAKSAVPDPAAHAGATGDKAALRAVTPNWFGDAMSACLREIPEPIGEEAGIQALAVGCSGGPDSMALTLLLKHWATARSLPLTALIVDHGLRQEASEEAARVSAWLQDRGVRAVVLTHEGIRPQRNIQAEARRMRYDLMRDWCLAQDVPVLAVAHHLEDQAETFLLRLARGSGVDGLAAMAPVSDLPGDPYRGVTLIRPLLDIPQAEVRGVLEQAGWPFVLDPSNRDIRHARVRMRNLAGALAMEGLDPQRLARTARNMRRARRALEKATESFLAAHAFVDPHGYAGVEKEAFAAADEELSLRIMTRLLRLVSGGDYPLRLERLENLTASLRSGPPPGPRTLGGCRIETRGSAVMIFREASAIGPSVAAQPSLIWDRRFRLGLTGALTGLTVGRLGGDGVRQARAGDMTDPRFEELPGPVRAALPALWRGDRLVAVARPGEPESGHGGAWFDRVVFEGAAAWDRMSPGNVVARGMILR